MDDTRASSLGATAIAHPRAVETLGCRSTRRIGTLDRLPPRTPGYADAQVPRRPMAGVRHGAIAHYWFYLPGEDADVAFGFRDIELAVTPSDAGQALVELYCVGDGFQSGTGTGRGHTIPIELIAGGQVSARIDWRIPDVLDGHADPITAQWRVDLSAQAVARLDTLVLGEAQAFTLVATDPLAR